MGWKPFFFKKYFLRGLNIFLFWGKGEGGVPIRGQTVQVILLGKINILLYIMTQIVSKLFFVSFIVLLFSTSTSVESGTEKLLSVHMSDATNLGEFLSDHFHIAYGTFYHHCE